jgi:hypothetical protein
MNAREWIHSRTPRPPDALTARIDALLAVQAGQSAGGIPETLQGAGDRLLADLLGRQASRESALDLLAADALMTYMMEWAAENIRTLGSRATVAMSRISAILDDSAPAA